MSIDNLFDETRYPSTSFPKKQLNKPLDAGRKMGFYVTYLASDPRIAASDIKEVAEAIPDFNTNNPLCLARFEEAGTEFRYIIELVPDNLKPEADWTEIGLKWQEGKTEIIADRPISMFGSVGKLTRVNDRVQYATCVYEKRTALSDYKNPKPARRSNGSSDGNHIGHNGVSRDVISRGLDREYKTMLRNANRPHSI